MTKKKLKTYRVPGATDTDMETFCIVEAKDAEDAMYRACYTKQGYVVDANGDDVSGKTWKANSDPDCRFVEEVK